MSGPEQAATVTAGQLGTAWRLLDESRAERDRLTERVAELVTEGNGLRALIAVILNDFEASDRRPGRRMQFDRYRELAGLTPAVTAGTEHLAEKIRGLAIPDEL